MRPGGQGHFGGEEDAYFTGVGSLAGDPPELDPAGADDQLVMENAMVDRIGLVPRVLAQGRQGHVLFFQADEVKAGGGFQVMPKAEINGGT
jgi:hypothetical protein